MIGSVQRLRDPIHGLIIFENEIDQVAWELIDAPEFQRLRRIKQLGFSEFTFPSATHNRFAHSIGVYHNARLLMKVVEASEGNKFDKKRADVVLLAALLHDIGHGAFSHAFEKAREEMAEARGDDAIEKHEKYSAKIINNANGQIFRILEQFRSGIASEISSLIAADDPTDIYHAVISSSFDADRLDFLVRDRYMTGTGAGAIDAEWLIDNLTEKIISVGQDDDAPTPVPTFVFKLKGRQAAEDFLLARYRLYTEVYLHKTTRGFEAMLSRLLLYIGDKKTPLKTLNLRGNNPLVRFLRDGETLEDYLALDDYTIWASIKDMSLSIDGDIASLARRLIDRDHYFVLDLFKECGDNKTLLANAINAVETAFRDQLGDTVFKDNPTANLYSTTKGEAEKTHKVVRILDGNGNPLEIKDFENTIISSKLTEKRQLIRYYFPTRELRDQALKSARGN